MSVSLCRQSFSSGWKPTVILQVCGTVQVEILRKVTTAGRATQNVVACIVPNYEILGSVHAVDQPILLHFIVDGRMPSACFEY